MKKQTIETPRLHLSIISPNDVASVFTTMNVEHTARTISFMSWPMTPGQAESWVQKSVEGYKNETDYLYLARLKENHALAGCIGLHEIQSGKPETGYWVVPEAQGQGFASEMLSAIINLAFTDLNLHGLWATAMPSNIASMRVLEKAGFQKTGSTVKKVADDSKVAERDVFELQNPRKRI